LKKIHGIAAVLMAFIFFIMAFIGVAGEANSALETPLPSPTPTPSPPLKDVPEDKLIKNGDGVGGVKFGMHINDIEKVFGRGDIRPLKTDFSGNSTMQLKYKKEGLIFTFFNGELHMILIENPEYGTKNGTHVTGDIGDAIREFGSEFRQEKSIVQDPDPQKQNYEVFYDKHHIAFKCKGSIILGIRLKTPFKLKSKRRK